MAIRELNQEEIGAVSGGLDLGGLLTGILTPVLNLVSGLLTPVLNLVSGLLSTVVGLVSGLLGGLLGSAQ